MASETEICNLALRRLGQEAGLNSLGDDSTYYETAKASMPIVRDSLLERHAWNFATQTVKPAVLRDKPVGWKAAYALPHDCLRVLTVLPEDQYDAGLANSITAPLPDEVFEQPWTVEMMGRNRVVLTNVHKPVLKYIRRVTEPGLFTPLFTDVLAWHLAASLAGPVIRGETGLTISNKLLETARYYEGCAIIADTKQRRTVSIRPDAPWWS